MKDKIVSIIKLNIRALGNSKKKKKTVVMHK